MKKETKTRFSSIYWQQFSLIAGIVLLTLLLLGASFYALSYNYLVGEKRDEMKMRAQLIVQLTADYIMSDGDIIVLSSDGISANDTPDGDGGLWLSELLEHADKSDLESLASEIADAAKLHEQRSDDMTVELVRVKSIMQNTKKALDKTARTVA